MPKRFDIREIMLDPDKQDPKAVQKLLRTPIEDLQLPTRTLNALKAVRLQTLKDIVSLQSPMVLLNRRSFGKKSLVELDASLYELGLKFRFANVKDIAITRPFPKEQIVTLKSSYLLNNFVWSPVVIEAFEKYAIKTIGELLASRETLLNHPSMHARDFDFIEKRIREWKVKW